MNLSKTRSIIAQVAKAEGRGHKIERVVGEGKYRRITLDPSHIRIPILLLRKVKHLVRKIETCNRLRFYRPPGEQRSRKISGAAADVEHTRIRTCQNLAKGYRGKAPPSAIEPKRQQMIRAIICRCDGAEELADMFSSLGLGVLRRRTRALGSFMFAALVFGWRGKMIHDNAPLS